MNCPNCNTEMVEGSTKRGYKTVKCKECGFFGTSGKKAPEERPKEETRKPVEKASRTGRAGTGKAVRSNTREKAKPPKRSGRTVRREALGRSPLGKTPAGPPRVGDAVKKLFRW